MTPLASLVASLGAEWLERLNGPLHFRLIIMPIVVSVLAIRAGLRDARQGRPPLLGGLLTQPAERPQLLRSALADFGRIFIVAVVLDTTYQLLVGEGFRLIEVLVVAVLCAIVPYFLIRGPVARLARAFGRNRPNPTSTSGGSRRS